MTYSRVIVILSRKEGHMTDKERLDRLEQAVAETCLWLKGNWQGNRALQSAAGQILHERREAEIEEEAMPV